MFATWKDAFGASSCVTAARRLQGKQSSQEAEVVLDNSDDCSGKFAWKGTDG